MRHAMKASDLLALVQEFVATHGGDTEIIRIEWELRTIGGEFNIVAASPAGAAKENE